MSACESSGVKLCPIGSAATIGRKAPGCRYEPAVARQAEQGSPVTAAEVDVQLRSVTRKQRGFRVTRYLSQRIKGK